MAGRTHKVGSQVEKLEGEAQEEVEEQGLAPQGRAVGRHWGCHRWVAVPHGYKEQT
jgi:hypothetical protein